MLPEIPVSAECKRTLNVVWDSRVSIGDRVLVVGAGVVGLLIAYLMRRVAGVEVTICDVNANRRTIAEGLGIEFSAPCPHIDITRPLPKAPIIQDLTHHFGITMADSVTK